MATEFNAEESGAVILPTPVLVPKSKTIRVRPAAHAWLTEEARARGESIPDVVDHLIRVVERGRFVADAQAGFARLRRDPAGWADFREEVATLDGTVADGLEDSPWDEE